MAKIIEGLWDCPYCEQKGISGLKKQCPCCGHPQDDGTEFYMGEEIKYVDPEKAAQYGQGADWTCSYCGGLNRYDVTTCANCGASREETKGSYFDNEKAHREEERRKAAEIKAREAAERLQRIQAERARKRPMRMAILLGILALLAFIFIPRNSSAEITAKDWMRIVFIQESRNVEENDWSVPDGGKLISQREEVHHYESVLDHYEDVAVQKSRQVLDGYDESVEYINNGDGTFTEETVSTPRYRTEYYTEMEEQPVYVEVPVMATLYTYTIDRWFDSREVFTEGTDDEPYWGDVKLASNEKEGHRDEVYEVTVKVKKKVYSAEIPESLFASLSTGDKVDVTVQNNRIIKINGVDIR